MAYEYPSLSGIRVGVVANQMKVVGHDGWKWQGCLSHVVLKSQDETTGHRAIHEAWPLGTATLILADPG